MTKEEIKDFLDVNDEKTIINLISDLYFKKNKYEKGVEDLKELMETMISRDRYNSLVKKYNKLVELCKEKGIRVK